MLTKSEKQIMDLLWSVDEPLSCTQIVELSGDKTWKDSYVHSLIKSLIKKDMVEIAALELISRSYARKFSPKLDKEQYYLREYLAENPENNIVKLFAAYADGCESAEEMRQLEGIIQQWKTSHNA
ncbi:BlaI/MecI/CopY family transcriptional regulator [Ruminococcus sp.]|uniref:BlaI/MecI/CopY family transcriptional regulator n=1 Tax=Ruminococcus sp. TaxID=41978 RepID=UPI00388F3C79